MIRNKKDLLKRLDKLSEDYLKLGIFLKELKLSLEQRIDQYTFKEMKELLKKSGALKKASKEWEK